MPIGLNEGNVGRSVCPGFGKSAYGASLAKTSETRTTKGNNSKGPGPMARIFFPTIQLVILVMCTNFKFLGKVVPEISLTQNKC